MRTMGVKCITEFLRRSRKVMGRNDERIKESHEEDLRI